MMSKRQYQISRTSYKALRRGLEDLEAKREHYVADTSDRGCASEDINAFRTRSEQEQVENQIGHIRFLLDRAEILDDDPRPASIDPAKRGMIWENDERSEPISKTFSSSKAASSGRDGQSPVNIRDAHRP